jgi:hypothetical protein
MQIHSSASAWLAEMVTPFESFVVGAECFMKDFDTNIQGKSEDPSGFSASAIPMADRTHLALVHLDTASDDDRAYVLDSRAMEFHPVDIEGKSHLATCGSIDPPNDRISSV